MRVAKEGETKIEIIGMLLVMGEKEEILLAIIVHSSERFIHMSDGTDLRTLSQQVYYGLRVGQISSNFAAKSPHHPQTIKSRGNGITSRGSR